MKLEVLNITQGVKVSDFEFSSDVFGKVNHQVIYDKIKNELANRRQGNACVKTRGEVSGGGKKPWKQKGTGRARAGSNRSPIWVGGGTVFGPQPRDYSYTLPKKIKRLAFVSVVSYKVEQNAFIIVDDFFVESGKTADAVRNLDFLEKNHRTVLVVGKEDEQTKRALRNIPWIRLMHVDRMLVHSLFYAQKVVFTLDAVEKINNRMTRVFKGN